MNFPSIIEPLRSEVDAGPEVNEILAVVAHWRASLEVLPRVELPCYHKFCLAFTGVHWAELRRGSLREPHWEGAPLHLAKVDHRDCGMFSLQHDTTSPNH